MLLVCFGLFCCCFLHTCLCFCLFCVLGFVDVFVCLLLSAVVVWFVVVLAVIEFACILY